MDANISCVYMVHRSEISRSRSLELTSADRCIDAAPVIINNDSDTTTNNQNMRTVATMTVNMSEHADRAHVHARDSTRRVVEHSSGADFFKTTARVSFARIFVALSHTIDPSTQSSPRALTRDVKASATSSTRAIRAENSAICSSNIDAKSLNSRLASRAMAVARLASALTASLTFRKRVLNVSTALSTAARASSTRASSRSSSWPT